MNKSLKTALIISILLFSVSMAIAFGKPLYMAIAFTCFATFFLITEKKHLPELIRNNTRSVSKTMLLMFLISITIPALMSAGTLPTLIYHTSKWMVGNNLLLSAFVVSTILSMILGSALGTLTILLPLFSSIAIQSGIEYAYVIGALISGVYIGDRCSPLSSGLHLLSQITHTDYLKNMKVLLASALMPFVLSLAFFGFLGKTAIINLSMLSSNDLIPQVYDVSLWRLMPLALMIGLLLLKMPITRVLTAVFLISAAIGFASGLESSSAFNYLYHGYTAPFEQLAPFIKTSGFKQMINVILVIFLSGILNSLMEADHLMTYVIAPFAKNLSTPKKLMRNTGILSIVLSMVTCSQAMTAMVTGKYMSPYYDRLKVDRSLLVMATANTGLNVVALIPWNVNGIMIKQLTGISPLNYIPFSFFVVMLTLFTLLIYPHLAAWKHQAIK